MWDKVSHCARDDGDPQDYETLPEVTLSAYDETGQAENVPVLKQRAYTGRILPSSVANIPCVDLGVDGILEKLNVPVCTLESYLYQACKDFVTENRDLGTAYARLRPHLYNIITHGHASDAEKARKDDEDMRRNMLVQKKILDGDIPPRRVWDLVANRVVPWWVARKFPWAISHAWVEDKDIKSEMTPINGYEWPVPIPKDTDLNLIRMEMLSLGAEYVWLDVLCLRQKGRGEDPRGTASKEEWGRREVLRQEEWKVDLPTIGWIYHRVNLVVYYFSGLGLPLSFKPGDFENERCWFNRGWTLQETRDNLLIAGDTRDDGTLMPMEKAKQKRHKLRNQVKRLWRPQKIADDTPVATEPCYDDRFMAVDIRDLFEKKLASLRQMHREESIFSLLSQMQKRKSTYPVDEVAGLVYFFYSQYIPIYDADQSQEDAWTELVSVTQDWFWADLLFLYPGPGIGNKYWHPSWGQVMTEILPKSSLNKGLSDEGRWRQVLWPPYRLMLCAGIGRQIISGDGPTREVGGQFSPREKAYLRRCRLPWIPDTRWEVYTHRHRQT
ncbi:uncharacterized protein EV420DRAFT_502406 [Desarmillaria tabescens]|uniref:Heterokaryon incompatibility domain-containing protein n=1 Tax=Armillaria tabescens TaxID=1929756 RepID=A0AA39N469_ARMTA|nr:uncharacterized protein EV420DRAFT_502406 [Desarmillaria tabescens]KAK0457546.1 hypothetical protein EV420DRAFT_502406 [Desarmillaria tabescens]